MRTEAIPVTGIKREGTFKLAGSPPVQYHEILVQRITKARFTNHAPMQVARILLFLSQMAALYFKQFSTTSDD